MSEPAEMTDAETIAEYYATLQEIEKLEEVWTERDFNPTEIAQYKYLSRKSWDMQHDVMWAALREVKRLTDEKDKGGEVMGEGRS